jgi:RNA polymerase sigma factor (sigma-70 family)
MKSQATNSGKPSFDEAVKAESFKNIVRNLCKKHNKINDPDWEQEFQIALWEGITKYNPERGEFWSYIYFVLSSRAIELAAKDRLVQLPHDTICGNHGRAVERNVALELKEEVIADNDDYLVEDATTAIALRQALDRLTPDERYLIEVKYGMRKGNGEYTGEQVDKIAAEIGYSRSKSWNLHDSAVSKLRKMLR